MYIYDCLRHFVTLEEDEDDEEGDESKMEKLSLLQDMASVFGINLSYCSAKTYVVGTQQNRLYETILLSSQNTCLN